MLVGLFPSAHTPIRACHRSDSSNLIDAISPEEELEAAQSNPTSESFSAQVRRRTRLTFQNVKKAVPLEQLNHRTERLRFAAPGADAP